MVHSRPCPVLHPHRLSSGAKADRISIPTIPTVFSVKCAKLPHYADGELRFPMISPGFLLCPENRDSAAFKNPSKERLPPLLLLPYTSPGDHASCLTWIPAPLCDHHLQQRGRSLPKFLAQERCGGQQPAVTLDGL